MTGRERLRRWRRDWCAWRGHPEAGWAPVVLTFKGFAGDDTIEVRAYRCALHDHESE